MAREDGNVFSLKSLFALTTLVAIFITGFLLFRAVEENTALRKRVGEGRHTRRVLNGYLLKALLIDQALVGQREFEIAELANACDNKTEDKAFLTQMLKAKPLTATTNVQFPNLAVQPADFAYCYEIPVPKSFNEGTIMGGFAIYVHDEVIVGIYPLFLKADW